MRGAPVGRMEASDYDATDDPGPVVRAHPTRSARGPGHDDAQRGLPDRGDERPAAVEVVKIGVTSRGHHQGHRDAVMAAVQKLAGKPVEENKLGEYAKALGAASLKSQTGVLRLALMLERGAANAYLGLIPSLGTGYHKIAAQMASCDAFHVALLASALGEPIPAAALVFG